jgi:hypothetical protein
LHLKEFMPKFTTAPTVEKVYVANVGGKYLRFSRLQAIPAGSKVYSSVDDLLGQSQEQLEKLFAYTTGEDKRFSDLAEAAASVWDAFNLAPSYDPAIHSPKDDPTAPKAAAQAASAKGKNYVRKRDSTKYIMKPETQKSLDAIAKLAPQAQACVKILRASGKTTMMEAEVRALIESGNPELRTRQGSWRIFQYYRSKLIHADVFTMQ